jgi:tRNA pseudouridine32 synthase/23S rRNA pseudouridine746 synthase
MLFKAFSWMAEIEGCVDLPLICDWPNRPKQMVDHDNGKQSLTNYSVLSYSTLSSGDESTLIELRPVTGRSHQLRVHMLALGHPILGDRLYAHEKALTVSPRLQLHARNLSLTHPVTGELLCFVSPCPFD